MEHHHVDELPRDLGPVAEKPGEDGPDQQRVLLGRAVAAGGPFPQALPELAELAASGRLSVPIWRTYPLAQAARAR